MKRKLYFVTILAFCLGAANAQDDCSNAVNIPVQQYSTCGEMALESIDLGSATPSTSSQPPACGSFSSGSSNDLWYSFTVPAGINTMAFHAFNSDHIPMTNSSAPAMAIYSGSNCSNMVLLDCFEGDGGFMQNAEIRWEQISGLTPGETIYMRIWDEGNLAQNLFIAASVRLEMAEDNCDTPAELTTGGCNILSTGGDIQAPETCGWNSTDNSIFYHFTVSPEDDQPYVIEAENGECSSNEGGMGENPEIQFAVYSWNGSDCNDIGGSPSSDPPNTSGTYYGCANGTGTVTFSENLPPGDYILAMDGYSMLSGNSLCTYGFAAPFINPALSVELNTSNAACGNGGSAAISLDQSCSGTPQVSWSTGENGLTTDDLSAGDYSVTVSDDEPCGDTIINFSILDEGSISLDAVASGDICNGPFSATAEVDGADPEDCDFVWSTSPEQTSQTANDLSPGTYTVTVTYGTCEETANVTVDYSDLDIQLEYETPICEGEDQSATVEVLNGTAPYTYNWASGASSSTVPLEESGTYSVTVTDDNGCTQSESFDITVHPSISITNFSDNVCDTDNSNYFVSFDVVDSDGPASFIVNGTTYTGSYNETFPSGTSYNLDVTDLNGCNSFTFSGFYDCDCVTDAGNMSSLDILHLCQNECSASSLHEGNEILDGNDAFEFIIHDGESPPTIFATNNTTEFCKSDIPALAFETIYYISAVAGNDDGSGHPDPSDACYSKTQNLPVIWHQNPIAHVVHNELSVCDLEVNLLASTPADGTNGSWSSGADFSPVAGSTLHDTAMTALVGDYGDITFHWTVNNAGCTNSDQVVVHFNETPNAYAGPDNTVCGLTDTLAAIFSLSSSSGFWSGNQVSFDNSSDPETSVTGNTAGTHFLTWTENNGSCFDEDKVEITFIDNPQPVIQNATDTVCGTSYNLSVSNVNGEGTWTAFQEGLQVYPTFDDPTSSNTNVSISGYDGHAATLTFVWTEINQEQGVQCTEQVETEITFAEEPYAYVGDDDEPEVCSREFTFYADTIGSGFATGTWISPDMNVTFAGGINNPQATVTIPPGAFGDSAHAMVPFIWNMNNNGCTALDTIFVSFYKEPEAFAGINDNICGLQYQLDAIYDLPSSDSYTADGEWNTISENPSTANFTDDNDPSTNVNVNSPGIYQFIWRENNSLFASCNDRDTVTIEFKEKPVISAGEDFDVCGNEADMNATSAGFEGTWLSEPGISYDNSENPNTGISYGSYGTVELVWQEANEECTSKDTVEVTFWRKPTAELAMDMEDTAVCGKIFDDLRADNPGSGVDGNWISSPSNGVEFLTQSYNETVQVANYGYYDFQWVESNHPDNEPPEFCSDSTDPWTVHFIEVPEADAGPDSIYCGLEGELQAELSVETSTGEWDSQSSNITIDPNSDPNATVISQVYTETASSPYDFFELVWTENNFGCTNSDAVEVRFARIPSSEMTIIPPRCFGEAASIKANEDQHPEYDWELNNGIVDSIWPPNSEGGEYRRLVRWPDGDTAHIIGLEIVSEHGCRSSQGIDTIFEPGVPGFDTEVFPDTCLLGKGAVKLIPDSLDTAFEWVDTTGTGITNVNDTVQYNLPANEYRIAHVYRTMNTGYIPFYEDVFGSENCRDTFNVQIDTVGMIVADFEVAPDVDVNSLVAPEAEVWFNNLSDEDELRTTNVWHFDDGESETNNDEQVEHIYTEPRDCYQPYLVVYARNLPQCRDTAYMDCIKVDDRSSLEVPNIFTPNGDGQNDFFQVEAKTLETFQGKVVNRWGNSIYEWENYQDEEAGWDGKLPGGSDASQGVYFYIITATGIDGYEYELTGPFHLAR